MHHRLIPVMEMLNVPTDIKESPFVVAMGPGSYVVKTAETTVLVAGDESYLTYTTTIGRLKRRTGEDKELSYFFHSWIESDSSLSDGDLVCVGRGERPDRIVRNQKTGHEFGVELTSVYLDDRSVIDHHRMLRSQMKPYFLYDPARIQDYLRCIVKRIKEKVAKAQGYNSQRDLILAVYLNERLLPTPDFKMSLQEFMRRQRAFQRTSPFVRIVFTGRGRGVVYPQHGLLGQAGEDS